MGTVEAALELAPDHLSLLRADPRRPGRRGADRAARRPPADHVRRPPLARSCAPRPGRGSGRRRVLAGRCRLEGVGMPRLRVSQLGAPRAREPPQPRLLGAPAVRGGRPGRPRLRRRPAALERGPPRGHGSGRWRPRRGRAPALPPGAARRSMPRPPPRRSSSSGSGRRTASRAAAPCSRADEIAWAHEAGLVEDAPGDRVRLTLRGRLLSNELFARLV